MRKKLPLLAAIAAFILAAAGTATAVPVEAWTADAKTGTKLCIVFRAEGATLLAASWSGPAADGKAEGLGRLEYAYKVQGQEVKVQADGGMKAGKLDGRATVRWSDGEVYEGDWQAGLREGRGKAVQPSGRIYEGDWKAGRPEGKGLLKEPDGRSYEGDWVNGIPEGKGLLRWPNGATYEGDYKQGVRHGFGVMKDPVGKVIYSGEWQNDKPVQKAD